MRIIRELIAGLVALLVIGALCVPLRFFRMMPRDAKRPEVDA